MRCVREVGVPDLRAPVLGAETMPALHTSVRHERLTLRESQLFARPRLTTPGMPALAESLKPLRREAGDIQQ